jgi:hypothetical protein
MYFIRNPLDFYKPPIPTSDGSTTGSAVVILNFGLPENSGEGPGGAGAEPAPTGPPPRFPMAFVRNSMGFLRVS